MFLPRVLRPLPAEPVADVRVQRIAEVPFSVLAGPVGAHVVERVAGTIASWDRWHGCVWFRAGAPRGGRLARELADACGHRWGTADIGPRSEEGPDPIRRLRGLLSRAPAEAVVVLEVDAWTVPGVRRLVADLHGGLVERRVSVLVITEAPWRRWSVSAAGTSESAGTGAVLLPRPCRDRLWYLAGRRPAVLHDVLAAAQTWGADAVSGAVEGVWTLHALLERLTRRLVDRCDAGELAALQTCVDTGYWHPGLTTPAVSAGRLRPWTVSLEENWCWLRPLWRKPLRRQLAARHRGRRALTVPGDRPRAPAGAPALPAVPSGVLQARLLGELEVRVDGRRVGRWYGKRGCSVLRYLLARPQRACSRDELLATFWPDVAPQVARNRLQVAVSGLRKAFGAITSVNVVEYAAGSYQISRTLRVDVDVDRFEAAVAAARRAERAGDAPDALAAYRDAAACYRGDFAGDAPSESWTVIPRENLRITYVDALASIGRAELIRGAHDECVAAARRMLEVDPCREDAHRLLMRCYVRQGRTYQAYRQYEFCRRMLRSALDVEPAPDTVRLYDAIRAGSVVEPALAARRERGR